MTSLSHPVRARATRALLAISLAGLVACNATAVSDTSAPSTAASLPAITLPSEAPSNALGPTASESPAASGSDVTLPSAVPTSIDPCQLVTAQEAGKLAGTTFGAGKEATTEGNARLCTYGASTPVVFTVEVAIAPDVATAKAAEAAAEADLDSQAAKQTGHNATVTKLPNFAPGADAVLLEGTVTLNGSTIGGRAIYVLRGTTFFGINELALNKEPPTADALKNEAITLLGRLP